MDILYPVCCGVDVHKSFLVATIITTKDGSLLPQYTQKRFSTFNSSLKILTMQKNMNASPNVVGKNVPLLLSPE